MNLNITELNKYNSAISNLANWSCTTYIRPHYSIKPHQADKMIKRLVDSTKYINAVYYTLEDDSTIYGSGTNDTFIRNVNRSIKHLHLLIELDSLSNIEGLQKKINIIKSINGSLTKVPHIVTGLVALRETVVKGLKLNQKAVGGIEQIRSRTDLTSYVNKNMSKTQSHHNFVFKEK
jgi:hypothetical protein